MIAKTIKTENGCIHKLKSMETEKYIVYVEIYEINYFFGKNIVVDIYNKNTDTYSRKDFLEKDYNTLEDAITSAKQYIIDTIW